MERSSCRLQAAGCTNNSIYHPADEVVSVVEAISWNNPHNGAAVTPDRMTLPRMDADGHAPSQAGTLRHLERDPERTLRIGVRGRGERSHAQGGPGESDDGLVVHRQLLTDSNRFAPEAHGFHFLFTSSEARNRRNKPPVRRSVADAQALNAPSPFPEADRQVVQAGASLNGQTETTPYVNFSGDLAE